MSEPKSNPFHMSWIALDFFLTRHSGLNWKIFSTQPMHTSTFDCLSTIHWSILTNISFFFFCLDSEWVNCKLHLWSLGLIGFYTPKFQKLDFTPWSLIPLAIYPPRLVFAVKWYIIMLMCFIIANSALKLRHFNDDQARSWHNQNYVVLGLNLKQKILA